jgi:hypothetical protein
LDKGLGAMPEGADESSEPEDDDFE